MLEVATTLLKEVSKEKMNATPFSEINKKMSPSEVLSKSEKNGISGDREEVFEIKKEVDGKAEIEEKSDYSKEVNGRIRTLKELEVYQDEGLEESTVNDRTVLKDNNINPDLIDAKGRTNLERMERGLAPLDENGRPYNLHHIGQNSDSPLAELRDDVHKSKDGILHDKSKPSEVHGSNSSVNWDKERCAHWKARAEEIKVERGTDV
ncbi:MAG TPA: nuclease [Arcobacter sp.]|nr:nuclease [Arcobacter sp.]